MTAIEKNRFNIGASHTIGSYVLPGEIINNIHKEVGKKIKLSLTSCDEIVEDVKSGKLDIGFIEFPLFDDDLIVQEWIEDELVVCSTKKLPAPLTQEELQHFRLISREKNSLDYNYIQTFLEAQNLSYDNFYAITEVDKPAAIIQSVMWSRPKPPLSTVAIVSKISIEYELKYQKLFTSRINNKSIKRKFYIVYHKDLLKNFDFSSLGVTT